MNISKMKKIWIIILFVAVLGLASCRKEIPEGDIKDFVDKLQYDEAYKSVTTAVSHTSVTYYENGVVDGTLDMKITIDKKDLLYRYSESHVTGYFYGSKEGQYAFHQQKTLTYLENEDEAKVFQLTDDERDDIKYSPEDVRVAVNNFFYTELEAGIYRGGFYYGDYVRLNCAKYYDLFSLNEDKTELTYSINTVTQDKDDTDILNLHSFTINSYGMLLRLTTTAKNNTKKIKSVTTTTIDYNVEIDKWIEL